MVVKDSTRIQLCGRLIVELQGRRLEESLRGRQGRLLFAYLAINRDRPVRRDELAEALWSGKGAPPAYESLLAPPLSRLRKALGPGVLEGRSELQLQLPEDAWIDWEVARARVRDARGSTPAHAWQAAREAVEIAERGLLPGLEAPWIDTKRSELADLHVEALEAAALAGARLGGAALPEAEEAARAAVKAQPYRESARAALMEVLRARGNVNEALRVYEDIRVLLREELGSSPGSALVALHQELLRDDSAPPRPTARPAVARASTLVERDREVALLDGWLQEATLGDGRAVLIEGPPGIGKSRLLAEFRRRAVTEGALVLNARAGELEREFPFGVVRQLFEGVVTDPDSLAGAAAAARVVFASPENGTPTGDASFAALHGLYWLALNLAAEHPLLLEIDDLHWCDRPSLRFLAYLVRRLEGQPVLVTASVRTGDQPTDAALLAEIANDPATAHVRPGPLSEEAVGDLVAKRLGAEPDDAFREACHRTTGGNPLLVRQLLNALETDHVKPDAAHADVVRAIGSRAVSSSVLLRMARLPGEAATVARAVAVLGESAELPTVAALSGLDEAQVAGAMAALARAEILRPEPPPGFVHPLVRDAVYTGLPLGERELLHARAAAVLRERGADLDQVAAQLMLTPGRGDAAVARLLHEAGNAAMSRGAVDSSVGYMQRALEEPPAPEDRARLLLDLGEAEALTRGPDSARHLREAYDGLSDAQLKVRAANALGRALLFTSSPAEGSRVALEAADALPPELADEALGLRAFALMGIPFGSMEPEEWTPARAWRGKPMSTIGEKLMGAVSALEWTQAGGHVDDVLPQAFGALAGGQLQLRDPNLLTLAASLPLIVGDRDEALQMFDLAMVEAHRRGSLFAVTGMYLWRGFTLFWRGDLMDAEEELTAAFEQAEAWGYGADTLQWNAAHLSWCLTERGKLAEARTALMRARERGPRSDGARYWCNARLELLVAEGKYEDAVEAAEDYAVRFRHYHNPAAARWSGLRAVALDALGMKKKAIALAAEELDRARDWGAPGTVARSLRVLGLLEGPEGLERLEEAVELVSRASSRLELAKSLAGLGVLRRLAGRPDYAREPLTRAHELAEVCGAERLLGDIRRELVAVGVEPASAMPHGVASLTATERRVAALAAAGRAEREIAQELFVTPRIIEIKLGSALRKLGASSTRELALALET
ncbi:AAA family ATPase [Solirubrobacter sp. CPCC 204708]|uniref:AAA family ATPase n=1 Tax=Solirubrobacter deserti TaxID=2282478 RepID=A0ABT4RC66_9ACTN|nr:AAA family ATPase [Solirubrobacter deserti]MBE2315487.1 AAA family ATPase [Solirubrobacter deserti]MDA0136127.1 AAA family ATPase [Solirubrobacter deserti]